MNWKIVLTIKPHCHQIANIFEWALACDLKTWRLEDLRIVNLFLFVGLPSLIHSPSSIRPQPKQQYFERPSSYPVSSQSFHALEQSTLLKQFYKCSFSFEYENRQFHVITCSTFLNDLCFQILFIKKPSLSRLYNVKCYKNVKNVFFNLYWKLYLQKIYKGKQLRLNKVQKFKTGS